MRFSQLMAEAGRPPHLSQSAFRTAKMCPWKWKLRYLDGRREPPNGRMIVGKAAGQAEAESWGQVIDSGEPLTTDDVRGVYHDRFQEAASDEPPRWWDVSSSRDRDSGEEALILFDKTVAPHVDPVAVERELRVPIEDELRDDSFDLLAYLDVEEADGRVDDMKMRGQKLKQEDADTDFQATVYMAGRRAEGNPAPGFDFLVAQRTKQPQAYRVSTGRSDDQLDFTLGRVRDMAAELAWRAEQDVWEFATGEWHCSEKWCGFWGECPGGGLYRQRAADAVRAAA